MRCRFFARGRSPATLLPSSFRLRRTRTLLLPAVACFALLAAAPPARHSHGFQGSRIVISSNKTFNKLCSDFQRLISQRNLSIWAQVNLGRQLRLRQVTVQARVYLIGASSLGGKFFLPHRAVSLYLPARVAIYQNAHGQPRIAYNRLAPMLRQFHSPPLERAARKFDHQFETILRQAAQ